MAKVMVFIDGSWLYANTPRLAKSYGKDEFQIDFGKLPAVVADSVREQLGTTDVDVVRTYLFGSYASNYHPGDDLMVKRRLDFYHMLREEHHYEVEIFPINYRGRRLRKSERDPSDTFEVKEKCVDISLATSMLYFAAIPFAYDIAIAVVGDQDFKPVLQHVRRLGKRVAIASIKGSCSEEISDPTDQARIKDFNLIWIDDLLHKVELKHDRQMLDCESPSHKGVKKVWTTFYPRRGQKFYCDDCKAQFDRQKQEEQQQRYQSVDPATSPEPIAGETTGQVTLGKVYAIKNGDKGLFAFIRTGLGNEYYFNPTHLEGDLSWDELVEGMPLHAEIMRVPDGATGKAGAVRKVWRIAVKEEPRSSAEPEAAHDRGGM